MPTRSRNGAAATVIMIVVLTLFAPLLYADADKAVKDALLKYNYGIIKMAKSGETEFFKSFVDEAVVTKLMLWVKAWQDNNFVMLAEINDFRFGPIIYGDHNATVTTLENWNFTYVDIATRKVAAETVTMFYQMRYTLQQREKGWVITKIDHLREEQFKVPEAQRTYPKPDSADALKRSLPMHQKSNVATH